MSQKDIHSFTVGDYIKGYFILASMSVRTVGHAKTPMLLGSLSDKTGAIACKCWGNDGSDISGSSGGAVYVEGKVGEYNNALQLDLDKIQPASPEETAAAAPYLVPVAPNSVNAMWDIIVDAIGEMEDKDYVAICTELLDDYKNQFCQIPAAKSVHHAFIGGLLMHTSTMVRVAQGLLAVYGDFINKDLLMAGVILHDLGKIKEFSTSRLGLVAQYSVPGQLMGHLVIGTQEVERAADRLGINHEKSMLLQHLLLSHHGEPEYGAAVKPACAEAYLLHFIDAMDAKMEIIREQLEKMEPGMVSDVIGPLGTRIYKHE